MSLLSGALDHLADEPHYVYEAWMGDVSLYVGMTCDLGRRLREHSQQQAWWKGATRFAVTVHPSRKAAEDAERLRIRELGPANNVCGNRDYLIAYGAEEDAQAAEVADRYFAAATP